MLSSKRVPWNVIKSFVDKKRLRLQYYEDNNTYFIQIVDGNLVFECVIQNDNADNTDRDDFEANYKTGANKPIEESTPIFGATKVALYKPEESSTTIVSHDWTDKTTWYNGSVNVIGETLTDNANGTWSCSNDFLIDVSHGKIYFEDDLASYQHVLYDGGTPMIEDTDYSVDYATGLFTIDISYTIVGSLTLDYWYCDGSVGCSQWVLEPIEGKELSLDHSEIQFTDDVQMLKPIRFEIWVYNPYFNSANAVVDWTPTSEFGVDNFLRFPHKVIRYKTIKDIINSCNEGTGVVPSLYGIGKPVVVFPFKYISLQILKSSQGAQLRITIEEDTPMGGTWGTATFYVISRDED